MNRLKSNHDFRTQLADSMGAVFYFCLRKLGNRELAEELAQDIALAALASLESSPPREFRPWLWGIARRRFARWAELRHRRLVNESPLELDAEPLDDGASPELAAVNADELSRLRRELAFVSRAHRELVVGYYIENRSIRELSASLSIHPEAVKSRLFRVRKLLKEGMDMAREFGRRSYNPEQISFVNNGISGELGQPWSVLTHSMYKNIFLEVYGNPETAEELAMELGVALPYMEDELEFLVRETFLRRENGRFETAFPIIGREVQRRLHEASLVYASRLTELLTSAIDRLYGLSPELYGGNISYEDAKWALLMWVADVAYRSSRSTPSGERTKRPNKGCWDIIGYQSVDFDEPPFVGEHGVFDRDGRECVRFAQFKFKYHDIGLRTPTVLSFEEGEALRAVALGEKCDAYYAERLVDYGYVRRDGGRYVAAVCIVGDVPEAPELTEASRLFAEANSRFAELIRAELPPSIRADEAQCRLACAATVERGYITSEALARGWLVESETRTLGAMLRL